MKAQQSNKSSNQQVKMSRLRQTARMFLLLFSLFFIYGTVLSGNMTTNIRTIYGNLQNIFWIPFLDCNEGDLLSPLDMFQNIILFIPFGLVWPLAVNQFFQRRQSVIFAMLATMVLSSCAEVLQLMTVSRITTTTDVIMNVVGTGCGLLLHRMFARQFLFIFHRCFQAFMAPLSFSFVSLVVMIIIVSFSPFDFSLDRWLLTPKVKAFIASFGNVGAGGQTAVLIGYFFFLLGITGCHLLKVLLRSRRLWVCLITFFHLILSFEVCRIINVGYTPSLAAVATWFLCFLTGYLVALIMYRYPLIFNKYMLTLSSIVLLFGIHMVYSLAPFHFSTSPCNFIWIPLHSYYEQSTVNALRDVLLKGGIYMPAGFMAATGMKHKRRKLVIMTVAVAFFAGAIECLQVYLPGRVADITDIFLAPALSMIGYGFYLYGRPYYSALVAEVSIMVKT